MRSVMRVKGGGAWFVKRPLATTWMSGLRAPALSPRSAPVLRRRRRCDCSPDGRCPVIAAYKMKAGEDRAARQTRICGFYFLRRCVSIRNFYGGTGNCASRSSSLPQFSTPARAILSRGGTYAGTNVADVCRAAYYLRSRLARAELNRRPGGQGSRQSLRKLCCQLQNVPDSRGHFGQFGGKIRLRRPLDCRPLHETRAAHIRERRAAIPKIFAERRPRAALSRPNSLGDVRPPPPSILSPRNLSEQRLGGGEKFIFVNGEDPLAIYRARTRLKQHAGARRLPCDSDEQIAHHLRKEPERGQAMGRPRPLPWAALLFDASAKSFMGSVDVRASVAQCVFG